ncbi:MAG TPA: U32 family peptidase [Woeseiaceae bacterium]
MTSFDDLELRLSLGPVQFHWSREQLIDFYGDIASTEVDVVYLGETSCSKRRSLRHSDWLDIARVLTDAGKEVVFSTLALVEAGSELGYMRKLCENGDYRVEANDMSAVQMLAGKVPFVGGPTLNIQNHRALAKLAELGMMRWVAPIEATHDVVAGMRFFDKQHLEFEMLAWGPMPLAYSARCYTARARGLTKDDCDTCCSDYPDGLMLATQEGEKLLLINGIQTMSARSVCLAEELVSGSSPVDIVRIGPQAEQTAAVIGIFDDLRRQRRDADAATEALRLLAGAGTCNGYWHGGAGLEAR